MRKKNYIIQSKIASEVGIPYDSALLLGVGKSIGIEQEFIDLNFKNEIIKGTYNIDHRSDESIETTVCLSIYTTIPFLFQRELPEIIDSITKIKTLFKNAKIIVAGTYLKYHEAEHLLRYDVNNVFIGDVSGIYSDYLYNENSFKDKISERKRSESILHFKYPDYFLIDLKKYKGSIFSLDKVALPLKLSAGCYFRCKYCEIKENYTMLSQSEILKYITFLVEEYSVQHLIFEDDLINSHYNDFKNICILISKNFPQLTWECPNGLHPQNIDAELLSLAKRSGCRHLALGIETLDAKRLKSVQRDFDLIETIKFFDNKDLNMALSGYFLIDLMSIEKSMASLFGEVMSIRSSPILFVHFSTCSNADIKVKLIKTISYFLVYASLRRILFLYKNKYFSIKNLSRIYFRIMNA